MDRRSREILDEHGLNWTVSKRPMTYQWEDTEMLSNKFSLTRDDNGTELNVVGTQYTPMQNETMVEAAVKASDNYGELSVVEAGSIRGGKKVYVKFKINGMGLVGNEHIERYITLLNNNDSTGGFRFAVGNKVMSCDNQFHYFDEKARLKMYHSPYLEEVIRNLDKYLEKALAVELKMLGRYRVFNSTPASRQLAEELVSHVVLKEHELEEGQELTKSMIKKRDMFYQAIEHETKEKGWNAFGLFNGITYATNHLMGDPDLMLFGSRAKINKEAYQYLEEKIMLV